MKEFEVFFLGGTVGRTFIEANSLVEANRIVKEKFPRRMGYLIEEVEEIPAWIRRGPHNTNYKILRQKP